MYGAKVGSVYTASREPLHTIDATKSDDVPCFGQEKEPPTTACESRPGLETRPTSVFAFSESLLAHRLHTTKLLSANEPAIWEGHFCLSDLPQGKRVDQIAEKRCAVDEHAKWIDKVAMRLRPVVPEYSVAYAHPRNCANGSAEPV